MVRANKVRLYVRLVERVASYGSDGRKRMHASTEADLAWKQLTREERNAATEAIGDRKRAASRFREEPAETTVPRPVRSLAGGTDAGRGGVTKAGKAGGRRTRSGHAP